MGKVKSQPVEHRSSIKKEQQSDSQTHFSLFNPESNDVEFKPSRRGVVGRPKGDQPKRKAVQDLSENANTKRSRTRLDTFTSEEKELERAKKADNAAIGYRIRRFKKTTEFAMASETEREARINTLRQQEIDSRIAQGVHSDVVARRLRLQVHPRTVVYADEDDDPSWEDVEHEEAEQDEIFLVARERDNILDRNRCGLPEIDQDDWPTDARLLAYRRDFERDYVAGQKMRSFVIVQKVWRKTGRSLLRKLRMLDCEDLKNCPKEGHIRLPMILEGIVFTDSMPPPHMFFDRRELAMWRNLASHIQNRRFGYDNEGWQTLPGPASLWPDSYDFAAFGFEPDMDTGNARRAYDLIAQGYDNVPADFELLAPGVDSLSLLSKDIASYMNYNN